MSQLTTRSNQNLINWEDKNSLEEIRKLFAPNLTEMEFTFFCGMAKATQLNPFLREIWAVKYQQGQAAQVFVGRDGYRKAVQSHTEYDYHQSDAVYENDLFEIMNGEIKHGYKLTNRGRLVGAYCIAKRHKSTKPVYVFVDLKEYSTGKSLWNEHTGKPATMIKKVAESQCLRACFQDLLGGTYTQDEKEIIDEQNIVKESQVEKLKNILTTDESIDSNSFITDDQLQELENLMIEKEFDDTRKLKALEYYKVPNLNQLTQSQYKMFFSQVSRTK